MSATELADALQGGGGGRWFVLGVVTAFASNQITATIDGASITGIRRIASWTTPAATDVGLFAVVRGSKSVQYIGVGKITP